MISSIPGTLLQLEKVQDERSSLPDKRVKVVKSASAAAVSAAAKVKTTIPKQSSDKGAPHTLYIRAIIREVASNLKIIIKIYER